MEPYCRDFTPDMILSIGLQLSIASASNVNVTHPSINQGVCGTGSVDVDTKQEEGGDRRVCDIPHPMRTTHKVNVATVSISDEIPTVTHQVGELWLPSSVY